MKPFLPVFHSVMAEPMEQFVAGKRTQGYDYTDQARTLGYFDRFLAAERYVGPALTPDLLQRYVHTTQTLARYSRRIRLTSVRQFSRWLQVRDPASAVLPNDILPRGRDSERFFPIQPEQVAQMMAAATTVLAADPLRARSQHTLLGLLYATGLRIGEALALTPADLASDGLTLRVARGKFGKERLVPLSPSTHAALLDYLAFRRQYATGGNTSPLFLTAGGAALTRAQAYRDFRRLCQHCGLWGRPPPRPHDLRHNYACRRLALWRQAGRDINAMLPILATAMGHVNYSATQRYLHVDAVALQDASTKFHAYVTRHTETHP